MDMRRIGPLKVSAVGLGCNNFGKRIDATQTERVVHAALDAGINFFDTADRYSAGTSETYLGRALRGRREEAIIATKFGKQVGDVPASATEAYIRTAAEASLRRLGVDTIDLYQIHEPHSDVPIAETLGALEELVRAAVAEAGVSDPRGMGQVMKVLQPRVAGRAEGGADREQVAVGDWLGFGISHPCTVFDKWQLIPVLDEQDRVVDLIRTFF